MNTDHVARAQQFIKVNIRNTREFGKNHNIGPSFEARCARGYFLADASHSDQP